MVKMHGNNRSGYKRGFPGYISVLSFTQVSLGAFLHWVNGCVSGQKQPCPTDKHPPRRQDLREGVRSQDASVYVHGQKCWSPRLDDSRATEEESRGLTLFYYWVLSYQSSNREAIREVSIWLPLHANLSHNTNRAINQSNLLSGTVGNNTGRPRW